MRLLHEQWITLSTCWRYSVPSQNSFTWSILIIKPTRCTNFSNLFLEWNSTCFKQFLSPSSSVFHCTHSNVICHTVSLTSWFCSHGVRKSVWHITLLCVLWKSLDDGQRNCLKHVEFYSKNKFVKLVQIVGFITIICHDAHSPERHILLK